MTKAILSRIETYDQGLHAYTTVTADVAMAQAKKAEVEIMKGIYRGVMHGIPIAVKDLCYTKGITTTGGMSIYRDFKDVNAFREEIDRLEKLPSAEERRSQMTLIESDDKS